MITPLAAANAYAAAQKAMGVDTGLGAGAHEAAGMGGGFADILKNAMSDAMKASKTAETQIANQVQGKAQLVDVVTAVSAAESSLETVMAIRDQVISAYQEIMRMPI
jgi:flagellar hook-basal body complex protein FliE